MTGVRLNTAKPLVLFTFSPLSLSFWQLDRAGRQGPTLVAERIPGTQAGARNSSGYGLGQLPQYYRRSTTFRRIHGIGVGPEERCSCYREEASCNSKNLTLGTMLDSHAYLVWGYDASGFTQSVLTRVKPLLANDQLGASPLL